MTADSNKWPEEVRRRLDAEGHKCEDVDALLAEMAPYIEMPPDKLMAHLHTIGRVLWNRGHRDLGASIQGVTRELRSTA